MRCRTDRTWRGPLQSMEVGPRWLCGGFAEASRRLRGNGPSFLETGSETHSLPESSCTLPVFFRKLPIVFRFIVSVIFPQSACSRHCHCSESSLAAIFSKMPPSFCKSKPGALRVGFAAELAAFDLTAILLIKSSSPLQELTFWCQVSFRKTRMQTLQTAPRWPSAVRDRSHISHWSLFGLSPSGFATRGSLAALRFVSLLLVATACFTPLSAACAAQAKSSWAGACWAGTLRHAPRLLPASKPEPFVSQKLAAIGTYKPGGENTAIHKTIAGKRLTQAQWSLAKAVSVV